ncbi:MAG TPA: MMPL family transporter [Candidatus Eisenbacteria bacterium]|nr:MMPL family transporter [Candidatus Eisenbacteria bacterium]
MLSRKTIEAYLFFLLRNKVLVSMVVAVITAGLAFCMWEKMHVFTNFFDLYPPNHPYVRLYQQYRNMFGTANTVVFVVEVQNGTIYDDPATVQKVERITLELLHDVPGVNGEQVMSITHPKLKTTLTAGSGIKVVPLTYPRVPETKDDLRFLRQKIRSSEYQGVFVSDDDKATQIVAGFWEEGLNEQTFPIMWQKIQDIVARESDANTKIYVTGPPILYAYFIEASPKMVAALAASLAMIVLILWIEFRSWQGLVIPVFSGVLSAIWGLGFGGLCAWLSQYVSHPELKMLMNVSMDPLVLVIPLLISARAHSHSVQSMERYHEEYHRLKDKNQAIVKSYTEIYAPAMVSLMADGLATLTLLVARIPLIQKLAILCSFWIISIFVSVVTLHPIILAFTPPPREFVSGKGVLERFMSWMMLVTVCWLFWLYGHFPQAAWLTIPGVGSIGLLGVFFAVVLFCGFADVTTGTPPPVYSHLGVAMCKATDAFGVFFGNVYLAIERGLIWLAEEWRRPVVLGVLIFLLSFGLYFQSKLKVGDATPGGALLYADHPYNQAFHKVNEKFTGASQLVVIAEGAAFCTTDGKPCQGEKCKRCYPEVAGTCGAPEKCVQREGTLQDAEVLNGLDLFARYMAEREEVGGTVTAASLLKKIFRTFHEAEPKWEILPTRNDHVAQLFFLLTSNTRRGEMDNFFDSNYANATVTVFYKDYTHETIENSIARAKDYIALHQADTSAVRYRLAGGIIGILAAVNEEVEWSYRVNLILILVVVFLLSYATYVSVWGALIVMLPSLVAQPLSEAVMYLFGIDMNINSLPVAAIGIGIGIDYGYYVLSRIVEELAAGCTFETAIRRMFETTGKTVLFTGVSLTASIIFWVFFPMKFQADMALLLVLLLAFHLAGALIFIPPMVALFRPRFAIRYAEARARVLAAEQAATEAAVAAGR